MALHQSEVITYVQASDRLRLRVRALIAKQQVAAGRDPQPEQDLTAMMWEIAVDPNTLAFMGDALPDQAAVEAKIAAASDTNLLGVINRVLAT